MSWTDKFWTAYGMVLDATIDVTATALNGIGSVACMLGGAGFATSYAIDEKLNASYYGSANTVGQVNLGFDFLAFDYSINETIPIQHYDQMTGSVSYSMNDYIHPDTVRIGSAIFVTSGAILRALSANIKLWQQSRDDKRFFKHHYGVDIDRPHAQEYAFVNAESVCHSLYYTFTSSAIAGAVIHYSGLVGTNHSVTYPLVADQHVSSSSYNGPVNTVLIPIEFKLDRNITIDLPGLEDPVLVEEIVNANGMVNATYGGGLFFNSHSSSSFPVAVPAGAGISAYLASSFFSKKSKHHRDERIHQAQAIGYGSL